MPDGCRSDVGLVLGSSTRSRPIQERSSSSVSKHSSHLRGSCVAGAESVDVSSSIGRYGGRRRAESMDDSGNSRGVEGGSSVLVVEGGSSTNRKINSFVRLILQSGTSTAAAAFVSSRSSLSKCILAAPFHASVAAKPPPAELLRACRLSVLSHFCSTCASGCRSINSWPLNTDREEARLVW